MSDGRGGSGVLALHPQVSVRPEPFGALLYHFGTRRLSFLKDRRLLEVVQRLDGRTPLDEALDQIPEAELPSYRKAVATLQKTGMLHHPTEPLAALTPPQGPRP